jgi:hypothetical protein
LMRESQRGDDCDDDAAQFDATVGEAESDDDGTVEAPAAWHVVLPTLSAFDSGNASLFGDYAQSRNVQRARMFRMQKPRAQKRRDKNNKWQPVPRPVRGTIPLAALVARTSVFVSDSDVPRLRDALESLQAKSATREQLTLLNERMPWGPQFVTGFVFEEPPTELNSALVLRWESLVHAGDEDRLFIGYLRQLFEPKWRNVFQGFRAMLAAQRLGVGWLPSGSVSDAINTYVRINRAGIRVQPEKRALAILTRARPELLSSLADYMHRLRQDDSEEDDLRDGGTAQDGQRRPVARAATHRTLFKGAGLDYRPG